MTLWGDTVTVVFFVIPATVAASCTEEAAVAEFTCKVKFTDDAPAGIEVLEGMLTFAPPETEYPNVTGVLEVAFPVRDAVHVVEAGAVIALGLQARADNEMGRVTVTVEPAAEALTESPFPDEAAALRI